MSLIKIQSIIDTDYIYTQSRGGQALKPYFGNGPYTEIRRQDGRVLVHAVAAGGDPSAPTGWFDIAGVRITAWC